jgi:outer membrane receptor protein involved in Fe transport
MQCFVMRPLALCIASLSFSSAVFAADLAGNSDDQTGNPLTGLNVVLLSANGSPLATTTTDAGGSAQFSNVPAGDYWVSAQTDDRTRIRSEIVVAQAAPAVPSAAPQSAPSTPDTKTLETVTVTARKFKDARIELSPRVGTTIYTINQGLIDSLGQGDATSFDDVLLRLPGVDKDSKASGSLHVRDDHGNVQYRIDGIELPENIAGFGESIDTRYVDQIDFLTGALPAEYGLRSAGVVDIQTKEGTVAPGGRFELVMGSHDTFEPSASFFGTVGQLSYYVSGSFTSNSQGIENPLETHSASHDDTSQTRSFADFSYFLDDSTRLGLLLGTYNAKFQIPTNPSQPVGFSLAGFSDASTGTTSYPSSDVNEDQREVNRLVALSYQKTLGDLDYQLSVFHQYSNLHFDPDNIGDLIYLGTASDTFRSNSATGLQLDSAYKLNPSHTVRFGIEFTKQDTESDNGVLVFPIDPATGLQSSNVPFNITDNSSKTGDLSSIYLQDEWRIDPRFTVNYGVRFDHVAAFINEEQWSPRLNASYKLTDSTTLHGGYSRYFTPPPQELASQESINRYANTTNQPEVQNSDSVKAERTHYFDIGITQQVSQNLSVAIDSYYQKITDLIDEGQFGQALILSPFNYANGFAQGLELSGTYTNAHWTGYLNFAYQKAQGTDIVSGQSLFGPEELAYIANHYIYLDHDQTYTLSGGVSYVFSDYKLSGDMLFGSGLRRTPAGGDPNSAALPDYTVLNATISHTWKTSPTGNVEARLALLNLLDRSYLIRDGTGVGVGAPQYGLRRTFYLGLSTSF